jgi:serine/threonine-protein kinase RsbW
MSGQPLPRCDFDSDKLILKLEATAAATVDSIAPLVDRVLEIAEEMGCSKGKEFEIEMALREALANAVIHGARNDPQKQIQLCVACDRERGMLIIVRDPGDGFDPSQVPSPLIGQNVFSEHGRGIYLINQLMDEVRYERGGTEIHMRKF